jgi:antitoxin VapB
MTRAKVFMSGRSQAIRLPKEFRLESKEVYLQKTGTGFTVVERDPWEVMQEGCKELSEVFFADRKQPPIQKRDWTE